MNVILRNLVQYICIYKFLKYDHLKGIRQNIKLKYVIKTANKIKYIGFIAPPKYYITKNNTLLRLRNINLFK